MAKEMYLVSFGDSSKYISTSGDTIRQVSGKLREGLHKLFPSASMDNMPVPEVESIGDASKYSSYPELTLKAVPEILRTLVTGMKENADVRELNNNAPWSNINPFGR